MNERQMQSDAALLLEHAEDEARRIVAEVTAAAEAERKRVLERAIEEGNEERARLVLETVRSCDSFISGIEGELVELVVCAVRKVFAEFNHEERVRALIAGAVEALGASHSLKIKVHPDDAERIESMATAYDTRGQKAMNINIEKSFEIVVGTCVIESDIGIVETSMNAQLDELLRAIGSARRASDDSGRNAALPR